MLKTTLLHPEILRACAGGDITQKFIADGNYPAATKRGPYAELVSLQLSPGIPSVAQVLRALVSALPIDAVNTMGIPPEDPYAKVWRASCLGGVPRHSRGGRGDAGPADFEVGFLQSGRFAGSCADDSNCRPGALGQCPVDHRLSYPLTHASRCAPTLPGAIPPRGVSHGSEPDGPLAAIFYQKTSSR